MASELTLVPNDLEFEATIQCLEASQQVFDRYRLHRVLGHGGMGVVWLAFDQRLEREIALKFLPDEVTFDPQAEDEMKREARRCLDLTHPNIVRIHDFVKDPRAAAISMEYVDGKTLAALKAEKAKRIFEVEELKPWIIKACQALAYAHDEVGIVHRDLKPGNLMLSSRGQIKIADFGISQTVAETMTRMTIRRGTSGTLAYMSPQQMNGDTSKVTDDVYALGATLYELLTSKPPFYTGDLSFQLRAKVPPSMKERRRELEVRGSEIPQEWEDAVAACLAKMPEQRPAGMLELADGLGLLPTQATRSRKEPTPSEAKPRTRITFQWPKWRWTYRPKLSQKARLATGCALTAITFACVVWAYGIAPLLAPRAELRVTSNPPGAVVHLPGRPDFVTPATISNLPRGHFPVTISAKGFDPVQCIVDLASGAKVDLGIIQLKRAVGQLELTTLPRRASYVLKGGADTGNFVKEGVTPDVISNLPSGSYQVTLAENGFPPSTDTVEVPMHGLKVLDHDLIRTSLAIGTDVSVAQAFRGELDFKQLDEKGKTELIDLFHKAFQLYLSDGFLAQASAELDHLGRLGDDTRAAEAQLAAKRASTETEVAAEVKKLIDAKKFATADAVLNDMEGVLQKESVDRLETSFRPALTRYQQQIDADLRANPPAVSSFAHFQTRVAEFPDDIRIQATFSRIQMQMPPDHDRLTAQLNAFRQLGAPNKDLFTDPGLLRIRANFEDELKQLDALQKNLSDAKENLSTATNRISRLKAQKDALQERRVGRPHVNPFANAVNFFGKVVVGHSVVGTEAVFSSREAKEEAVADVQAQIDAAQQNLSVPQRALDDAQKRYNDFVAVVPWDQE